MANEQTHSYFPYTHGDHIEKERLNLKNELKAELQHKQLVESSVRGMSADSRTVTSPMNI